MTRFFKKYKSFIYISLLSLTLIPLALKVGKKDQPLKSSQERYNESLSKLNSVEKAVAYIDSQYNLRGLKNFDTAVYTEIASRFTKDRFFHGLARYDFSDNWICYLCSKYLWDHFSAVVDPDDVLKHSEGLCSQQSIVFMEFLKRKGIKTRSVGLGYKEGPGHFLTEVYYKGGWHLHDVTMEPKWDQLTNHHESFGYYLNNKDSLFTAYAGILPRPTFDKIMEKVEYGDINHFPAGKMWWFQQITNWLTYLLPALFLFAFIASRSGVRRKSKIRVMEKAEHFAHERETSSVQ